jgi:hypothetical protein
LRNQAYVTWKVFAYGQRAAWLHRLRCYGRLAELPFRAAPAGRETPHHPCRSRDRGGHHIQVLQHTSTPFPRVVPSAEAVRFHPEFGHMLRTHAGILSALTDRYPQHPLPASKCSHVQYRHLTGPFSRSLRPHFNQHRSLPVVTDPTSTSPGMFVRKRVLPSFHVRLNDIKETEPFSQLQPRHHQACSSKSGTPVFACPV